MSELETYLVNANRLWYDSVDLIRRFGREQLNALYAEKKIEVRQGLNNKVVKYENY